MPSCWLILSFLQAEKISGNSTNEYRRMNIPVDYTIWLTNIRMLNCGIFRSKIMGRTLISILFILFLLPAANAQEKPKSRTQQKKELKKKKEDQIEKRKKREKELIKRHMDIQSKQTRKQMRKAKRASDRLNRRKRRY